jgi:hypothetical protein
VARVEVKVEDHALVPLEARVISHDADVIHRAGVAGDGQLVFFVGLRGLLTPDERRRLSQ